MDFQAVIMAAGKGSRMAELTAKTPKSLLPVGCHPMIWYSLNFLQRNGFKDAIITLPASHKNEIMNAIHGMTDIKLQLSEEIVQINEDGVNNGTADVLNQILKTRDIKSDLLVVSSDLVTDVSLDPLFALHYTHRSAFTALFCPLPAELLTTVTPGPKTKQKFEKDFIGLDPASKRLIFMYSEADFDEELILKRHLLKSCPRFTVHSNLLDAHVYAISKNAVKLWSNEDGINSLKGEVVPLLTRRQFAPPERLSYEENYVGIKVRVPNMSSWEGKTGITENTSYCCYGYVATEGFSIRANNLTTYMCANRQISRLWPTFPTDGDNKFVQANIQLAGGANVGADCFVGKNVVIGAGSVLKGCVIGNECNIGSNVKLTNCVIMDRVVIEDGGVLQGCIISRDAKVSEKCSLKDCIVATDHVAALTKSNNEIIINEDQLMEI